MSAISLTDIFWLTFSLVTYFAAVQLCNRLHNSALANPLLMSTSVVMVSLVLVSPNFDPQIAKAHYESAADILLFMLGPATVALALPLYDTRHLIMARPKPIIIALMTGSLTAIVSAAGLAALLGASPEIVAAMSTKSITSPLAIMVIEQIFSDRDLALLATSFVIMTGLIGCVLAPFIFSRLNIHRKSARGLAVGVAAHGIGTASLFRTDPEAAPFSALAMVVNGLLTVLLLPIFFSMFLR